MGDYQKMDLPNQMTAYYIRMPNTHSVVISFFVRAGLRYEDPKHSGVSHLIEHLLFRRLDQMEQRQLYYELECMGTTLRATTYVDFIRFYVEILPEFADRTFQILIKLFHSGRWTTEDIRKEKRVVINQINENPFSFLHRCNTKYWAQTPFGNPIMGTADKVDRISIATISHYYQTFFQPQNCAFVVSGNFAERFEDYTQSELCKLQYHSNSVLSTDPIFPRNFCKRTSSNDVIIDTTGEYTDVRICFEADYRKISKESVQYIHSILGDGDGSRLSMLLREELGIVDEIYSEVESYHGFSILTIQYDVTCDRILETIDLVYSVIIDLMCEVSDRDIRASVHFLTSNRMFDLDSPESLNFRYGWRSFIQGERFLHPEEESDRFRCITPTELRESAQELFKRENLLTFISCNQDFVKHSVIKRKLKNVRSLLGQASKRSVIQD